MKIAVWDTYVKREDGITMHFDILLSCDVKDEQAIFNFGLDYLKTKSIMSIEITANECRFCHIEQGTQEMIASINKKGYAIIEMANCN